MSAPICRISAHYTAVCCRCRRQINISKWRFAIQRISTNTASIQEEIIITSRNVHLTPQVHKLLDSGQVTYKGHPGVISRKSVSVPERIETAISILVKQYKTKHIVQNAEKLSRYLWGRHIPLEQDKLQEQSAEIEDSVRNEINADVESMSEEQRRTYESRVKGKLLKKLRAKVYHWEPVKYDAYRSFLYLIGRAAADYAVIMQCFQQIQCLHPDFKPRSIFDMGSGIGTVTWAANQLWAKHLYEYYCLDSSPDVSTLARLILQDGNENKQMHIAGVYFRQFQPSSLQNKFDMVVCAYTLFELPSHEHRLQKYKELWQMTDKFLILVENGTTAGHNLILEARNAILQLGVSTPELQGYVYAPCSHDLTCPKLNLQKRVPCNFEVNYQPLEVSKSKDKKTEMFSYVIMRKGYRQQESWPRVVKPVAKPSRHTHLHLCCSDGTLKHTVLTVSKHHKHLYKCSRYTNWGDMFPATIPSNNSEPAESDSVPVKMVSDDSLTKPTGSTDNIVDNDDILSADLMYILGQAPNDVDAGDVLDKENDDDIGNTQRLGST